MERGRRGKEKEKREMNNRVIKLLILAIIAMGLAPQADAGTRTRVRLLSSVLSSVSIQKEASSVETGSLDVTTGVLSSPMTSVFTLQTNLTDDDCDYILTSSVNTDSGAVSGYGYAGGPTLLFTNSSNLPSGTDVSNAKAGSGLNKNVIAYPISVTLGNGNMSVSYQQDYSTYGDCFVILVNGETNGTVTQTVGTNPVASTFRTTHDTAGNYTATVTFTAISKI